MPILKSNVPFDVAAAFSVQLPDFVWIANDDKVRQQYVGAMERIPSMTDLGHPDDPGMIHDAHRFFVLGLKDAAKNVSYCGPTSAGWRFFAGNARGKILLGTVSHKAEGWRMTAGYYGDRVWTAFEALKALDGLEQVQEHDYKLRVLAVPGLNLEVFWLVSVEERGVDLVVPFPAMPDQRIDALNREPFYSMANFLTAIRPVARVRQTAAGR